MHNGLSNHVRDRGQAPEEGKRALLRRKTRLELQWPPPDRDGALRTAWAELAVVMSWERALFAEVRNWFRLPRLPRWSVRMGKAADSFSLMQFAGANLLAVGAA